MTEIKEAYRKLAPHDVVQLHAATAKIYRAASAGTPSVETSLEADAGELAALRPPASDVLEEFDWSNSKVMREFVSLEQKVLANRATREECARYRSMKQHRTSIVFADRYVRDYLEVQRLKKLSQKLAEWPAWRRRTCRSRNRR